MEFLGGSFLCVPVLCVSRLGRWSPLQLVNTSYFVVILTLQQFWNYSLVKCWLILNKWLRCSKIGRSWLIGEGCWWEREIPQPGLPQMAFFPHTLEGQGECEGSRKAKCRKSDCGCSPFPAVSAGIIWTPLLLFHWTLWSAMSDPFCSALASWTMYRWQSQSSEMFRLYKEQRKLKDEHCVTWKLGQRPRFFTCAFRLFLVLLT